MVSDAEILNKLSRLAAAFNAHDIDAVMRFFAPDCSLDMPRGSEPHGTRFQGIDQVRRVSGAALNPRQMYITATWSTSYLASVVCPGGFSQARS